MIDLSKWMNSIMSEHIGLGEKTAELLTNATATAAMILAGIALNWILQKIFSFTSRHNQKIASSKWHAFVAKRRIGHHILLLLSGIFLYFIPYLFYEKGHNMIRILHRADIIYMIIVLIMVCNAVLLAFLDFYSTTEKNRNHPLQGLIQGLQVLLYFVGGIIIIAVMIDKSPAVLLTGLGASAAVLMLVFKDSILGFVAGVQLSQNDMLRLGDWIQMPDGSANGNVEEITLNTVKVRNWDNTISMIPPYTLVTTTFKNWRGMQESGGRRSDKRIFIDLNSLETYPKEMTDDLCKNVPLMKAVLKDAVFHEVPTNIQLYRMYIEAYLKQHPDVNPDLDIIVSQKESTAYGLPIEVYFFTKDKTWAVHERKQSDIYDHLMTIAPEFGLRIYQRP